MNKKINKEFPAKTEADSNPKSENQYVSQPNANTNIGRRREIDEEKMMELISSIKINDANIDYIRSHPERKINGSLFLDIKRILQEYAEFKNKTEYPDIDIYESIYMEVVELVEKDNIECELYSKTAEKLKEHYLIRRK